MGKAARDKRPHVKPVESIEVEQKHVKLRLVLLIVFLVIGVSAIAYGVVSYFTQNTTGWQIVTAEYTESCADDFVLLYEFGQSDVSGRREYNAISDLYSEATVKAYRLFHEAQRFDGVSNIAYLNDHPNETVAVDGALYEALAKMENSDLRHPYLAPLYEYYHALFSCTADYEITAYDPALNDKLADLFSEILIFANDPEAVSLELMGENRVRLNVSREYQRFAESHDIVTFYSFHFMKNAFIADYLADALAEAGYTHGSISSYDGFCRNLDDRALTYGYNLFDRIGNSIYPAGTMNYTGPLSIVSLRSFPVGETDSGHYYVFADGETRFPYISTETGLCLAAENDLLSYSEKLGCADILLSMIPVYIAEDFDPAPLTDDPDIDVIFCRNNTICYTEESLTLSDLFASEEITYKSERISSAA